MKWVLEWCRDVWYHNYYGAPTDGSAWESGGSSYYRLQRGGSWFNFPHDCRSAYRCYYTAGPIIEAYGFRVVLLSRL